ncbi:MAG: ATP-dependent DNA helicase [Rhodocyclaceae bacterium]|nr:ATP-dependent DNA helicase [Rhodocyclaceae bacterium]
MSAADGLADPAQVSAEIAAVFAPGGPLARRIPGFNARPQQVEMAQAVMDAIDDTGVLLAEAGTGTGKTFAYLVPALLSGGKVIVSTGTRALQDQLYQRDVPAVRDALGRPVTVALLKGRSNYICHHHLKRTLSEGLLDFAEQVPQLRAIERFSARNASGDRALLAEVPEDAPIWAKVTSTRENCLGSRCDDHERCFVLNARRNALKADVVVVNHHLFFADILLKDEGGGELLPACNTVIFDEAHQLPETATLFFGADRSTAQLLEAAREVRAELRVLGDDDPALKAATLLLEPCIKRLRSLLGEAGQRLTRAQALDTSGFGAALDALIDAQQALADRLVAVAGRSETLTQCSAVAQAAAAELEAWRAGQGAAQVFWLECATQSVRLHRSPLSVAPLMSQTLESNARGWVFTSATLSAAGDFSLFREQMGLADATARHWDSPFNYATQARLYVPPGLPEPASRDYNAAVIDTLRELLPVSRGRAFGLFTSLRALREAATALRRPGATSYPVLVQGDAPRHELLERFKQHGNAVLLGSMSFWEGVDVRGEALSLVVIDKLPFAAPDDPVLAARIDQLKRLGRNAFIASFLPDREKQNAIEAFNRFTEQH